MARFPLMVSLLFVFILAATESAQARKFFCSSGDVTCLIAAINSANRLSGKHIINLDPGIYTIHAPAEPSIGLPIISGSIEIKAVSDDPTIIERDVNAAPFRIFTVAVGGELVLDGLIVQRGGPQIFGAAIANGGSTRLRNSIVTDTF